MYSVRLAASVALRKESVDRNQYLSGVLDFAPGSLSARRAWIEICGSAAVIYS